MTLTLLEQNPSWLSPLWMTEEDERELSASDGDHESSSPHAARNAHNIKEIATHFVLAMTQSNFFINTSLSLTLKIEYSLNTLS